MGFFGLLAAHFGPADGGRSMPHQSAFHRVGRFPQSDCSHRSAHPQSRGNYAIYLKIFMILKKKKKFFTGVGMMICRDLDHHKPGES